MKARLIYGEMAQVDNEVFQLFGNIAGEMRVDDIPLASGVDVNELKKGDDDPLEVVVEIPASKSKRGWNYTGESMKDIVNAVMSRTLNGFLGHQKPEDVNNQFLPPVTHWVGAKMEGETAYFRGIVDAAAKDLKRWIRAGRIRQVSIFGMPKLKRVNGETNVVGYNPLSIDWTPLDRAGMNTRIVAMSGEMWDLDGQGPGKTKGDDDKVEWAQIIAELKKRHGDKTITVGTIAGEMGLTDEQVIAELTPEFAAQVQRALEISQHAESILGVTGEMDVKELFRSLKEAADAQKDDDFQKSVGEMLDTKITSDAVKKDIANPETQIGKMWDYHKRGITSDMSREQIAGEIDNFLNDKVVKDLVSRYHTDKPAGVAGTTTNNDDAPKNMKVRRTTL